MSKWIAVTAALLVALAGSGVVQAAAVELSIVVDATIGGDGKYHLANIGDTVTYTVYGLVTGNTTDDGYSQPNSVLDGGFATWTVSQDYSTDGGQITHTSVAAPPTSGNSKANTAVNAHFGLKQQGLQLDQNGNYLPASFSPVNGVGGVEKTAGAMSPPGAFDYLSDQTPFKYGNGTAAALYTGTLKAVANGTVTLDLVPGAMFVWSVAGGAGIQSVGVPTGNVTGDSVIFQVGATATITIETPDVGAGDWSGPGGWANDARSVAIDSTVSGATEVAWTLTNPNAGGSTHTLAATTADFSLTMGEINALFGGEVPGGLGEPVDYNWILTGTVNPSDSIFVFVPEPTTIGLLGFGVVGALLRRRRRA